MNALKIKNALAVIAAITCLSAIPYQALAAEAKATTKATKERLVLMPLRVDERDKNLQGAMETALAKGLQLKYDVFSGEQVAQKAREIFLKESRATGKTSCDETRCMQDIAEAFQAELIAIANVAKLDEGYFLSLSIQNIFDHKLEYSESLPCKRCDAYQVVEKLKELSGTIATQPPIAIAPIPVNIAEQQRKADQAIRDAEKRKADNEARTNDRYIFRAGIEPYSTNTTYTGTYGNKKPTSSYVDTAIGLNMAVGNSYFLDIATSSGSGKHNLYSPAQDQTVKHSSLDLTFSAFLSGNRDAGWKYFVGYKTDTTQMAAIGQAWHEDKFVVAGVMGGVDFRYPVLGGTLGLVLEEEFLSAKWTDDAGFSAQSKNALGTKIMFGYSRYFSRRWGATFDYTLRTNRYDFSAYQVDRSSGAGSIKLLLNF